MLGGETPIKMLGGETPIKKLNRGCDDFCAQLLTLKKYSPAGLLTKDEARRDGGQHPPQMTVTTV